MPLHSADDCTPPQPRRVLVRPWLLAVLAAIVTLATYLPALAGEFVWDDAVLIEQSPAAQAHHRPLLQYFTKPFWEPNSISPQMNLYYRPLVALSYVLDHNLHGLNSAGYRITNYAFHTLNVLLIFALLRKRKVPALSAAVLATAWGVLPRLSESVAWISGRTDIFATSGVLLAILFWQSRLKDLAWCVLWLLLALFCKETAIAGYIVLITLAVTDATLLPRQRVLAVASLTLAVLAWFALRYSASGLLPTVAEPQTAGTRCLMFLEAIGRYCAMLGDWLRPRAEIGAAGQPNITFAIIGAVTLLVLVFAAMKRWSAWDLRTKASLLGALAAILPVLHIVPLSIEVSAADRFLYLPTALLLLSIGGNQALCQNRLLAGLCALVIVTSVPATAARATRWANPTLLWADELKLSGGKCRICRIELCKIETEAGDYVPALHLLKGLMRDLAAQNRVAALVPLNIAVLEIKVGNYASGLRLLRELTERQPDTPRFWRERAAAEAAVFDFEAAEASARRALQLMPSYRNARLSLRLIGQLRADYPEIREPTSPSLVQAQFLTAAGRVFDAERLWLALVQQQPSPDVLIDALNFMVEHGSSAAVADALNHLPSYTSEQRSLVFRLREKQTLHAKLTELGLVSS